jgi:hypothetical protein
MTMTPPDSLWHTVNAVYFWPFRGWEMFMHPQTILEKGEYRYFRFVVPEKYADGDRIHSALSSACVLMNGGACYEDGDNYYCEGFLEPQCDGVTIGRIQDYLKASQIEIAKDGVGFLQELTTDLDDFLSMKSGSVVPTELAQADEQLLSGNYYAVAASYYGNRPGSLSAPLTAVAAKKTLDGQGMGFYQPYPDMDPIILSFILYTGANAPTPRDLNNLLKADYTAVNRLPLDKEEQESLWKYDAGKNIPDAIVHFFENLPPDPDDDDGPLTTRFKWFLIGGASLIALYGGLKVRQYWNSKGSPND